MSRKEKKGCGGGGGWKDKNRDRPVREVAKREELMAAAAALAKLPEC